MTSFKKNWFWEIYHIIIGEYGALKKEGTEDKTLNKKIEILKKDLDNCSKKLADIQSSLKDFLVPCANIFLRPGDCKFIVAYFAQACLIKLSSMSKLDHCF